MAFDPRAQQEMVRLYRLFMSHMHVTAQAIARLGTDIGLKNIAEARDCLSITVEKLNEIEAIVKSGQVITDVQTAKEAIEKLSR
jgi:hypothetical protein